jgi:flagellar basal body rod protein FlgG
MSNKVIINGNEYSYGEIVESEFFDDKSKEIVLNGEVVKVGDVWLNRELDEVLITNISIGRWPIRDNKDCTYSVYGIADFDFKVSGQDLMTKYVKDIPYTEDVKDVQDTVKQSIQTSYDNLTKVDRDEEMLNLITFQAAYTANAKIVTAIDDMLQTLLGMKR